ncbi:MAG: hypothetical protein R2681_00305 [Pyrinomonadaceae bacterium]
MFTKQSAIILLILSLTAAAFSQESEPAAASSLTNTKLPENAERIHKNSVPEELNTGLDDLINAGEGKLIGGNREVLAWSGAGYNRSKAENLIGQFQNNLRRSGWEYEAGGTENDLTVFTAFQKEPRRRVMMGFYIPTDDALVLAWTEVLSADNDKSKANTEHSTKVNPVGSSNGIFGTWTNGNVSSLSEKNLSTGAISSRGGSTFKYVFSKNGGFEFIGLMNSTMYGCTTSLFNDKRGRFEVNGSKITLVPSKNFWRKQYSCAPKSNSEQNYKLDSEILEFSLKTDEYGKSLICFADTNGESCYRKED